MFLCSICGTVSNITGHRSFYGPTSIYQKYCITDEADEDKEEQTSSILNEYSDFRLSRIFKIDDLVFNSALSLFFRHLNAECPFIDGPTLLGDFFHDKYKGKFWSYPLLYAICCLGARISPEPNVSKTADSLGRCVHEMLSIRSLESPHATTVQALLCLAYVELGVGNNTKGWMLSGKYPFSYHAVRRILIPGRNGIPDDSRLGTSPRSEVLNKRRFDNRPGARFANEETSILGLLHHRQV